MINYTTDLAVLHSSSTYKFKKNSPQNMEVTMILCKYLLILLVSCIL